MFGTVFSIEEFSVYDGPGIRTSVFLKGCPLRCMWCHNPEGQSFDIEIVKGPNGCIGCGNCIKTSDLNGRLTEESILKCPMNLIRFSGEKMSDKELSQRLLKNERILKNGGGVTFSGGEPLAQSEFLFASVERLKGRLHTAIQTCGFADRNVFERALELSDFFLFDLKLIDDNEHKKYTGVSNKMILSNFSRLAKSGKDFVVRIPLIPSVTDTESNIRKIAGIMEENGVGYAELLPYNKMAGGKYKMLMREYKPTFDESAEAAVRREIFEEYNIKIRVL